MFLLHLICMFLLYCILFDYTLLHMFFIYYACFSCIFPIIISISSVSCVIGPVQMQVLSWQWITLLMERSRQMSRQWAVIMNVTLCLQQFLCFCSVWSGFGSIPASFPELKPHSSPRLTSDPSCPLSTALLSVSVSSRPNRALALLSRRCVCVCVWNASTGLFCMHVVLYTKMTNALSKWHVPSWLARLCAQVYLLVSVYTK